MNERGGIVIPFEDETLRHLEYVSKESEEMREKRICDWIPC